MPSRLMSLPAELRVQIYEYVFHDNDHEALNIAAPEDNTPVREIDILTARNHYPQASLLRTCRQIHQESEPTFEEATKTFWSIELFTVELEAGLRAHATGWKKRDVCAQLFARIESMSLLRSHTIKSLRITCQDSGLAVTIDAAGDYTISADSLFAMTLADGHIDFALQKYKERAVIISGGGAGGSDALG